MAKYVFKKPEITLGGTPISNFVTQASVRWEETNVEEAVTAGEDWASQSRSGKKRASATLSFVADGFNASQLETTMNALLPQPYGASTSDTQELIIKPSSGAISATNPGFTCDVIITSWEPLGGGMVGQNLRSTHTWPIDGELVRDITP